MPLVLAIALLDHLPRFFVELWLESAIPQFLGLSVLLILFEHSLLLGQFGESVGGLFRLGVLLLDRWISLQRLRPWLVDLRNKCAFLEISLLLLQLQGLLLLDQGALHGEVVVDARPLAFLPA